MRGRNVNDAQAIDAESMRCLSLLPCSLHLAQLRSQMTFFPIRRIAIFCGSILLAVLLAYFGSPYWSLFQIKRAVDRGDGAYVSAHVDFPRLRESLKTSLEAETSRRMGKGDTTGFKALGAAFAAMMAGPVVDALVTPEGVIALMKGKNPGETTTSQPLPDPVKTGATTDSEKFSSSKMKIGKMGYEALDLFVVQIARDSQHPGKTESRPTLLFSRTGLFGWKLCGIRISREST